jgi:hypothetical protein
MQMQQQPMGGGGSDMQGEKDDLWREVLDNPDAWWDNRERKNAPGGNPRYPDFKHKVRVYLHLCVDYFYLLLTCMGK